MIGKKYEKTKNKKMVLKKLEPGYLQLKCIKYTFMLIKSISAVLFFC